MEDGLGDADKLVSPGVNLVTYSAFKLFYGKHGQSSTKLGLNAEDAGNDCSRGGGNLILGNTIEETLCV